VRRAGVLAAGLLILGAGVLAAQAVKPAKSRAAAAPAFDESLPVFGTQISELPPGAGKATADGACVKCHSADVLRQQRLNEKQWAASVAKMAGWGADVPEAKRDELAAYLAKNFGPDNDRFQPVVTRPTGR
jgi:mono/diheme cytochrome c family protein